MQQLQHSGMRFNLYRGREIDGQIKNPQISGYGFQNQDADYLVIKLMLFPRETYYLYRNRDNANYTLYSKKIENGEKVQLQDPVGYGKWMNQDKIFIVLKFADLPSSYFLSFAPDEMTRGAA